MHTHVPYTREHKPTSLRGDYLPKLKVRMLFASVVPRSGTYLTVVLAQHRVDPCSLYVVCNHGIPEKTRMSISGEKVT